jgi:hypothetical protein
MRLPRLKTLWIVLILILFVLIGILAYAYFPKPVENEINVCLHLSDYDNQTILYLNDLRVRWVRTDWIITSDNSMKDYSQDIQNNNINLLTIIDINTFNQKTPALEEWKRTVTEIVNSEDFNNTDAVEIWNEPNAVAYIPPETYYEMLKSAYAIIKNYTEIPVVFAGVSPNVPEWQAYLTTVFAYGDTEEYFDYMGIHFYDNMTKNLNTLQFVKGLTSKTVWLTETGKPSASEDYSEHAQAEYLSSIYSTFKSLVNKIFIYELKDGYGAIPEKENHFGLLTVEGNKKESYQVIWNIGRK